MRTTIITVRKRIITAAPWLPWLVPGAISAADALSLITPAIPVYLFALSGAITITAVFEGARHISRLLLHRLEQAAEQAQVKEAGLLSYQAAWEHCRSHHHAKSEELPVAVGETTERLPGLHLVRHPEFDVAAAPGRIYRATQSAKTVPQQSARLASARPQLRQP